MTSKKQNYWASALGFDDAQHPHIPQMEANCLSSSTAPMQTATPSACTNGAAQVPTDEDDDERLEQWVTTFHARMQEKDAERSKRVTEQMHRDDEEIERWKLIRQSDELQQQQRDSEVAREAARCAAARELEAESKRELARIEAATIGFSEQDRLNWVADEKELEELEAKALKQSQHLDALNEVLQKSVAILERKLELEEQDRLLVQSQKDAEHAAVQQQHVEEQAALANEASSCHCIILAEEPLARGSLVEQFVADQEAIGHKARMEVLASCDAASQEHILSLRDEAERRALLDELVLLRNMQRVLSKLEQRFA